MEQLDADTSADMICPSEDDVSVYIEGRASATTVERILRHLDRCSTCRQILAHAMRQREHGPKVANRAGVLHTFFVGETINGRYRISRFMARGGMGEVYEAWDTLLQERIALKTIVCTSLDDAKLLARIRSEVQLARRVTHPNVCRILEFGLHHRNHQDRADAIPYFTMELLGGETLARFRARRGIVAESEALPIIVQVLEGLSAIHAAGIVHRDLKPENVFVIPAETGRLRAVVTDFGLARSLDTLDSGLQSSINTLVGTPAYMAPEQAVGSAASVSWDIYALGVMLFEVLTGQLPFEGPTAVALALARVKRVAPAVTTLNPQVGHELETIVARCLQRDPKHRYPDVEALRIAVLSIVKSARPTKARHGTLFWWALATLGGLLAGFVDPIQIFAK